VVWGANPFEKQNSSKTVVKKKRQVPGKNAKLALPAPSPSPKEKVVIYELGLSHTPY